MGACRMADEQGGRVTRDYISNNGSGMRLPSVPRASASGPVLENRSLTVAVLKAIIVGSKKEEPISATNRRPRRLAAAPGRPLLPVLRALAVARVRAE